MNLKAQAGLNCHLERRNTLDECVACSVVVGKLVSPAQQRRCELRDKARIQQLLELIPVRSREEFVIRRIPGTNYDRGIFFRVWDELRPRTAVHAPCSVEKV